jgi:hypothetical protein
MDAALFLLPSPFLLLLKEETVSEWKILDVRERGEEERRAYLCSFAHCIKNSSPSAVVLHHPILGPN